MKLPGSLGCRVVRASRTPQGVRGLKLYDDNVPTDRKRSHPARGAWIEIGMARCRAKMRSVAPRKGRVD